MAQYTGKEGSTSVAQLCRPPTRSMAPAPLAGNASLNNLTAFWESLPRRQTKKMGTPLWSRACRCPESCRRGISAFFLSESETGGVASKGGEHVEGDLLCELGMEQMSNCTFSLTSTSRCGLPSLASCWYSRQPSLSSSRRILCVAVCGFKKTTNTKVSTDSPCKKQKQTNAGLVVGSSTAKLDVVDQASDSRRVPIRRTLSTPPSQLDNSKCPGDRIKQQKFLGIACCEGDWKG